MWTSVIGLRGVRLAADVMGNVWGLTFRLYVDLRLQAGDGCRR
jgi:hypothetical protein